MSDLISFSKLRLANTHWHLLVFLLLYLCAAPSQSQQSKRTESSLHQDDVVSVKTNLISIDVMVKDKKGKFISDLKAEDFAIFENGVAQRVEFFDPPLAVENETGRSTAALLATSRASGRMPRNIISLVLDGQTTDLTNLKQVREGTLKYIREQISDTDSVALFAVTNGLRLLQPFTQDKNKLVSAVEKAYATTDSKSGEQRDLAENIERLREESKSPAGAPDGPGGGSAAAQAMIAERVLQQFIKLRTALSLQQSRPILAALAAICEAQRTIPGKKTLVLFSQGFVTPAVLDWQVQSTIDMANRANVAIYIIDSAGLRASVPSGTLFPGSQLEGISALANQDWRVRAEGGDTVFDNARHEGVDRQYDILYRLSGDTGGKFIKGSNDIAQGLKRIDQEIRSRYTLAYHSTDQNFDGSFRKLKIEVHRPASQVISRLGYFATAHEGMVPLSPEEKKLLANAAAWEATPALPLFVELTPFRSEESLYVIPLSIEVPAGAVKFERKADKQRMQLEILGVVRAPQDKIISRVGGSFDVGLGTEQYQSLLNDNVLYRQDLQLGPGSYDVELIVRDRLSGKVGAKKERLVLPEADSEFATTKVVLSRHAEPASHASGTPGSGDVLGQGGVRIRPFPSRHFRVTDNLILFFELYNAATNKATGKPLVRVTVVLMNDDKAVVKPIVYELSETLAEPVPHLIFAKYITLAGLPTGRYSAIIESEDMVTHKRVKQQASFVITKTTEPTAN